MEIKDNTVIKSTKDNVFTEIEGEATILNTATGTYYGLNETGTAIWKLIQTPVTFKKIIISILSNYKVEKEVCKKEINDLLLDMNKEGMITINNNE